MAGRPGARHAASGAPLVGTCLERSPRHDGCARLVVATAAADIGNLRFYQRCGFRFAAIDRDAFTAATGYPDPTDIDGIPLRDRIWLSQDLRSDRSGRLP